MQIYKLTDACCVAGQIQPADVEALKNNGFATVVCNRPDGEDLGQPTAASVAAACESHGVAFHHLPISNTGISAEMVERFQKIVAESDGTVLAYCRSGQRSSVLWQQSGSP
ncbi:MAG: TIGR01244 family phosphatase [Gammaproteobacteria bacterium]|nr:TIGR01244 family phosphatase [Gammaproteobacteria bacterium]MBT8110407.1 TIGR01244 family phosphatase [Gammaproteobacteria bacterium]NND46585.1 TIGR01244 family phosphatase [Woeseiaceae bacterium]NNL45107.1 TIGR01244 family phosphatase [Woeseiaceae bacterium]